MKPPPAPIIISKDGRVYEPFPPMAFWMRRSAAALTVFTWAEMNRRGSSLDRFAPRNISVPENRVALSLKEINTVTRRFELCGIDDWKDWTGRWN